MHHTTSPDKMSNLSFQLFGTSADYSYNINIQPNKPEGVVAIVSYQGEKDQPKKVSYVNSPASFDMTNLSNILIRKRPKVKVLTDEEGCLLLDFHSEESYPGKVKIVIEGTHKKKPYQVHLDLENLADSTAKMKGKQVELVLGVVKQWNLKRIRENILNLEFRFEKGEEGKAFHCLLQPKEAIPFSLPVESFKALNHAYVENWDGKYSDRLLVRDWVCLNDLYSAGCPSDYLHPTFGKLIKKEEVSTIFEVGSRDGIDAICLSEHYKAKVFAFECNPEALKICKNNLGDNPNVDLIPLAVWNESKPLSFFPIVTGGLETLVGLSSLLKIDESGPIRNTQPQREVNVQATRLDEWMESQKVSQVDLLCIDVQGGTLQVLQGLGDKLKTAKYIIAEVESERYYVGQSLFPEVEEFLKSHGFMLAAHLFLHEGIYKNVSDVLFIKEELM